MITQNQRLTGIVFSAALILLIPLVAMQFTNEVKWTLFDFVVAGTLLFGTGLMIELVLRKVKQTRHRILLCGAIILALLLVWVELAVGIFGTPFAGN